jgi:hypothetical protein
MSNLLHGWDWTLRSGATQIGGTSVARSKKPLPFFRHKAGQRAICERLGMVDVIMKDLTPMLANSAGPLLLVAFLFLKLIF